MKITVLGCGSSGGVPLIGPEWGTCDPKNLLNRRLRPSILVEQGNEIILVDTTPDLRQQLLDNNVPKVTAVLYTHAHADHCHGIDELRSINWITQKAVPLYTDAVTMGELEQRFPYVFKGSDAAPGHYYKPGVAPQVIEGAFNVGEVPVMSWSQDHGYTKSLGFRFGDFAYSTDVHSLDENAFAMLAGVKYWIVDCVREAPQHPTHSHLPQTLQWIERVRPEKAWLTHMNHTMDYDTLVKKLPSHVAPAHDGMIIEC